MSHIMVERGGKAIRVPEATVANLIGLMEHKYQIERMAILADMEEVGSSSETKYEAIKVLRKTSEIYPECQFAFEEATIGGAAYDAHGVHFPDATKEVCDRSDAIFFGSIGGPVAEQHLPKWKDAEKNAVLGIRKAFDLAVNVRPTSNEGDDPDDEEEEAAVAAADPAWQRSGHALLGRRIRRHFDGHGWVGGVLVLWRPGPPETLFKAAHDDGDKDGQIQLREFLKLYTQGLDSRVSGKAGKDGLVWSWSSLYSISFSNFSTSSTPPTR